MNKLTALTLVAIVTVSLTGCGGSSRWFCRGDACGTTNAMYEGTEFGTGPALQAPTLIPQRPGDLLPGPVTGSST